MAVTQQWVRPQGMPGIGQINGTSYRDRDTGQSYSANFTYPLYRALRETAADSADLFVYTFLREVNVSVDNQAVVGGGALVSGNYFRGLGIPPALGRTLTDEDD